MQQLLIHQSMHLEGDIYISGAKNAALPIMCASLLSDEELHLLNVPKLRDIDTLCQLLKQMGVSVINNAHNEDLKDDCQTITLNSKTLNSCLAPYELVKQMRASILVLGPLLARHGVAEVSLPGGCAIGSRPVDIHLHGLELMGAKITLENGYIKAKIEHDNTKNARPRLMGAKIVMDTVTVTGTENLLMAATLATGTTILENAACEPEVTDLAHCLCAMGAQITGIGTNRLVIHGVDALHKATHIIMPDRIEAATYAIAAIMTQGKLTLHRARPDTMAATLSKLTATGAQLHCTTDIITITMEQRPQAVDITTAPYPGFATDIQAQFMALNSIAVGDSLIVENIFENRYMHVAELSRLGANITINGNNAMIKGVDRLRGAKVMATDLRASACLVLAGLVAHEEPTLIDRVYHLDRGYSCFDRKLNQVGARIARINA